MIRIGEYNQLVVKKELAFGLILDDGGEGILLPKRFVPRGAKPGDTLKVFLYHDSEDRVIATTQHPKGIVGDIVLLRVVSVTPQGAFLDNGLMKDLFVPKSKQLSGMRLGGDYLVKIFIDHQTGRLAATEKIEPYLSNVDVPLKEKDLVQLTVFRRTDIGYLVIIDNKYTGVLHFNEIYRDIAVGDKFPGFIKNIIPVEQVADESDESSSSHQEFLIDVAAGKPGYQRVEDEAEKVLRLLKTHNGYLPYHDKSDPEEIYSFFGMSKKTFKMTTGRLYKERKIEFTQTGIKLLE